MKFFKPVIAAFLAAFFVASAQAQNAGTVTSHAFAIGKGPGTTGFTSLLCGSAQLAVGQSAADPICQTITGDWTLSAAGAATLATVNSNVGSFGSATQSVAITVNAKGLITAASASTITPAIGSVTGLGTGCATFLATPSSANLRSCLTDEVGTGAAYFVGGALGTPASATLTNATGLPLSGLNSQASWSFVVNNTSGSASPTAVDIGSFTAKASPAATDLIVISDQAASGALKRATIASIASAGSVSSIAGNTGVFTLSKGITNSGNDIQLSLTNATVQSSPANPTATTSTTGVMMGLGSSCTLTPVYGTRVKVEFNYTFQNTGTGSQTGQLKFGTGTAPANGAAATGTNVGKARNVTVAIAGAPLSMTQSGIITGLVAGTSYWFDLDVFGSSGTTTVKDVDCNAMEF